MRIFGAAVLATSLLVTNVFAAPLPAGKPAGVKKAQEDNTNMIMIISGIGLAGLGIGLAASNGGGSISSSTTAPVTTTNP